MRSIHRWAAALSLSVCTPSFAGNLLSTSGTVASLHVEGMAGLIALTQPFPATCGARAWVDMNTALGRSIYATAMLAFATKQQVTLRAFDDSQRVLTECAVYDIDVRQ